MSSLVSLDREKSLFFLSPSSETRRYEYEIFSILRSARARTSVIWAGKFGSRRHSTTSFSADVVVTKTSYQMLEVLSFCDRETMQPPSLKITELTFPVKYGKMKLSGKSIFWEDAKKVQVKSPTRSRSGPQNWRSLFQVSNTYCDCSMLCIDYTQNKCSPYQNPVCPLSRTLHRLCK